jgi:cytochrome P450
MDAATATRPRRLDELPTPPGLPLLGQLLALEPTRLHQILEGWHAGLGSPYLLRLGPRRAYVSADPDLLQSVLRERPERYRRMRQIEDCIAEMGSNGVFSVEGEAWRPQRKLVMEGLNATHFRGFFPALQAITARLHRRWAAAAASGKTVEMTQDLIRYTVDVTTALAFGEDPNTLDDDGDVIQRQLALVFPRLMARINAPLPYWRWVRLPADRALDRALAQIHAHIDGLIVRARRRLAEQPGAEPRNVLEIMLRARDEPGSGLSDDDLRANVMTLLLAGEDTTAHTLAWTVFFLARHPVWQDRLHAQARETLQGAPVATSLEQVRTLDLFEAAANESTRLKPIVPLIFLEPNADVVLGDVALPAGTPMIFLLRPAMLDERRFTDALTWRPDRWSHGHPAGAHDTRAYVQFGAGPRVCPGRHLAGVEVRLVLAMLMAQFKVALAADPDDVREVLAFTMTPDAMPVRLQARH